MLNLFDALLVDLLVVVTAAVLLLTSPNARLSHPGVIYVGVHAYIVTLRGWAVHAGALTFLGVDEASIARAVVMADVFLVAATVGWVVVARRQPRHAESERWSPHQHVQAQRVAVIAIPVGVYSILTVGYVPGVGEGSTVVTTSYQLVPILWPVLALVALIYHRGFLPALVIPLAVYLAIMGVQGYGRYRVVIPLIMLLMIHLDRRNRRWPPIRLVAAALVVFAVFLPLKSIGAQVQAGDAGFSEVLTAVTTSSSEAAVGVNKEQGLLDQAAIVTKLTDDAGSPAMGRPYLALLTLPVPRPWWPDKPGLGDYMDKISTFRFPIGQVGGVAGLPGDLYLNFRWPGVVLGAFLFAWASGSIFRRAYAVPRGSVARFVYVLLAAALVQVARDGLASIVIFTLVNGMPWVLIAVLSRFARQPESETASADAVGRNAQRGVIQR